VANAQLVETILQMCAAKQLAKVS